MQRGKTRCNACGKDISAALQRCSRCQKAVYCNKDCQKAHWAKHKATCNPNNKKGGGKPNEKKASKPAPKGGKQKSEIANKTEDVSPETKGPPPPKVTFPRYDEAAYLIVSPYENENYPAFTRADCIYFLEKILKLDYYMELIAYETRGFYALEVMKSRDVLFEDPRIFDNVFHHQITLTATLPRNWNTHNFMSDARKPPGAPKRELNLKVLQIKRKM